MRTRYLQVTVASIIGLVIVFILIGVYLSTNFYSATVSCTGQQFVPVYVRYSTTTGYVTQTRVQLINTTTSAPRGHIGYFYSTTVNYTTTVEYSGSIITLYGGYANLTCTYIR